MKKTLSVFLLIAMLSGTVMFGCQNNAVNTPDTGTTIEETTIEVVEETTAEETTEEETTAEEITEEETTAEETTAEETTAEETTAEETTAEEITEEETTAEETTAEETTAEETTADDPATVIPTYTGKLKPRIINTVYPTKDVVIAEIDVVADGYDVDPTGEKDSTAGIQKALDDVYKNGGGTVFLPAGQYRVTKTIEIRPFTSLHGDWCDPDLDQGYGTVILADVLSVDSRTTGLFRLACASGVVGLTVYYPNQSLDNILPYPFTFYIDGAVDIDIISALKDITYHRVYMMPTVKNTTIINGYRGIGANCNGLQIDAHEKLNIENFHGTFLCVGAEIYNSMDVNVTDGVFVSTKYWLNASENYMTKPKESNLNQYVKNNTTGLILGDLEWSQFSNLNVDGCKLGIHVVPGTCDPNVENIDPSSICHFVGAIYGINITNCETGIILDAQDDRWGTVIASGYIDGGIYNNSRGFVKLTGVTVNGDVFGSVRVEADDNAISNIKIDYDRYYKKPVDKLYIASFTDKNDIGKELQMFVNEAGKTGGVVYIPAGIYEIYDPIVVPAGVEIRGATSIATRGHEGSSSGTILLCGYGDKRGKGIDDQALITLEGKNSGVNGLMLVYYNNLPGTNTDTSFAVRGGAEDVYVINCMIAASAYGVDFRECDNHLIKNVVTFCYEKTYLVGGKNGAVIGCLQNPTVLLRTIIPNRVSFIELGNFAMLIQASKDKCNLVVIENAENQLIYNTFSYAPKHLIVNNNSTNTRAINLGADQVGGWAVGDGTAMIIMNGGSMTTINTMRVYGHSYDLISGKLTMYNRTTIWEDGEGAANVSK